MPARNVLTFRAPAFLASVSTLDEAALALEGGAEIIDRIAHNRDRDANLALLRDLCDTMTNASLCALGGLTPLPVLSALRPFPGDLGLTSEDIARAKLSG